MEITVQDAMNAVQEVLSRKESPQCQVKIHPDTRLSDLMLESLDIAEILVILEEKVGDELNASAIYRLSTVRDLIELNRRESQGAGTCLRI